MADELRAHLGAAHAVRFAADGVHGVAHPESPELAGRAKTFLQNTGGFLSSREAEDRLVRLGALPAVASENSSLAMRAPRCSACCGAPFPERGRRIGFSARAASTPCTRRSGPWRSCKAARGRTIWVQLGWLYLDTIAILKRFTGAPSDYVHVHDVFDRAALERLLPRRVTTLPA